MFVYASITDGRGTIPLGIRIIHEESEEKIAEIKGNLAFTNPLQVIQLVWEFRGLKIPKSGSYAVEILSDEVILSLIKFSVEVKNFQPPDISAN